MTPSPLTNLNFDIKGYSRIANVTIGIGIGGGVLWTYTRTLKGEFNDVAKLFKELKKW